MAALTSNGVGTCGADDNQAQAGHLIAETIRGGVTHTLTNEGFDASEDGTGRGTPIVVTPLAIRGREHGAELEIGPKGGPQGSLRSAGGGGSLHSLVAIQSSDTPLSFAENQRNEVREETVVSALSAQGGGKPGTGYPAVREGTVVRRLTELECERLQGYPDGWTEGQAGSARYRQLGNSVAVPVVEWIARRVVAIDAAGEVVA